MGLKLYWTEFAQRELENIYDYYREKAGAKISKRLIEGIYNETLKFSSEPNIGQAEDLLKNREESLGIWFLKTIKLFIGLTRIKVALK